MSFQSTSFIAFMLILLVLLAVTKTERIRQYEILIASVVFYGLWDVRFLVLVAVCIIMMHFAVSYMLKRTKTGGYLSHGKLVMGISVTVLLVILGIFKYLNFFISGFCTLFSLENTAALNMILPVGISFYVFSAIGYIVDVYRGDITDKIPLYQEALYLMFFPKILQGPFHQAKDFLEQLKNEHPIEWGNISAGMQIFLFGLIKKIVIADRMGLFVDAVYSKPAIYSGATLLLGAVTYPIQLYCDFSGYSDMAAGVSKIMGYDICRNFNLPFMAENVAEYWRRWHMSLNNWFRDYLFYPIIRSKWVNGIRKKAKKRGAKKLSKMLPPIIGMVTVWPLIGLWHGASVNYVLYGVLYGLLMIIGFVIEPIKKEGGWIDVLRIIRTLAITVFVHIIFRAPDLATAGNVLCGILIWRNGISYLYTWSFAFIPIVMGACIFAYKKNNGEGFYIQLDLGKFRNKLIFCTVVLMTIVLMYVGENYFVYFKF